MRVPAGQGVRKLGLHDIAPDCEIFINREIYDLAAISRGKKVVDIGCGFGRFRKTVEDAGGEWVGVEPFEGGANTVVGDTENLPFANGAFDVVLMHAVLEHIPDVAKAFSEVARVLKKDGLFIGYSAFMECFHEISYSHLSFKALEHYAKINAMKLEKISGGGSFGIDYHLTVLFYPLKIPVWGKMTAWAIRAIIWLKSKFAYLSLRLVRKQNHAEAREKSKLYFQVECLRQSVGFEFVIRKV